MKLSEDFKPKLSFAQKVKILLTQWAALSSKQAPNPDFLQMRATGELMPVFKVGGKQFYRYANEEKLPPLRAFAALDMYDALERKVDPLHLEAYLKAVLELCNTKDYAKIAILTNYLFQKTQHLTNIELVYDLATVLYLDETENPNDYDFAYGYDKKRFWQNSEGVQSFFLRTPLKDFLPFSGDLTDNSQHFLNKDLPRITQAQREGLKTQLTALIPILSKNAENKDLLTRLKQRAEALENITS